MRAYGIDAGTRNNPIVVLEGDQLATLDPLAALVGGPAECRWTDTADALVEEIEARSLFPLGVDAALSAARGGDARPWESIARGFNTPALLDPLPSGGSKQSKNWWQMARLWTRVACMLVRDHGWTLWEGRPATSSKLIVEVYPRMSCISLAAALKTPIESSWSRVGLRDAVLGACGLRWDRKPGDKHVRDAAICALTISKVLANHAGFLGEPLTSDGDLLRGGGIALPAGASGDLRNHVCSLERGS
jgi:hypothetical protein